MLAFPSLMMKLCHLGERMIWRHLHLRDEDERMPREEEVEQAGHPAVRQPGQQVFLLEGSSAGAALQRDELSSKHLCTRSVCDSLHHPKCASAYIYKKNIQITLPLHYRFPSNLER